MRQPIFPVKTKPSHVALNGLDVFLALLAGIGIVKTQKGTAAVLAGNTEIQANGLRVTDMQIAVRFGWKPGYHVAMVLAARDIIADDLPDEVPGLTIVHEDVSGCPTGRQLYSPHTKQYINL